MNLSANFKIYLKLLSGFIPFRNPNRIFCRNKIAADKPGPNRFLWNLSNEFEKHKLHFERNLLFKCRTALFLSNSLGDAFLQVCKKRKIKTVLRADGFYIPAVFDNKAHSYRTARYLNPEQIDLNQRMQKDLSICDWVVYQSNFSKKLTDFFLYNRTDNFSIIYNGVDIHHFKPKKKQTLTKPLILIFGSFRDPDLMWVSLNTYGEIAKAIDSRLKIIGPMTDEVTLIAEKWLKNNPLLESSVTLKGNIGFDTLPEELSECDLSLHLKPGDWCPNAVIETLSCGVPVVCHRYGGTKEIVEDAGAIVNYKPYVYDEIFIQKSCTQALEILKDLPTYAKRARDRAVQHFDMVKTAEKYRKVLLY